MFKEETIRWKKRRKKRAIFLMVALFLSIFLYFRLGGLGSEFFALSLQNLLHPVPEFKHILLEHNGEKKVLTPGQTLHIHPTDYLKIAKVSTSIPFNRGIRLYAQGFDVNALKKQTVVKKLLPNQDMFHHYAYTIHIKYNNNTIGRLGVVIAPSVQDWLTKANRIIDPQKKIAFLQTAVKEEKDNLRIKIRLADEYLSQEKWKKAAQLIEDIVKKNNDLSSPMISKQDRLNIMQKLLHAYERLHDHTNIIATIRKILSISPEDLDLRLRLAELLEKTGKAQEAANEYIAILPKLPKNEKVVGMKNIGYLLFQADEKNKALHWYLKAAEYDKKDPNLYYNIGSIYDELGKTKLAEQNLRTALELNQDDIDGRLRLAQSLFNKNKTKDAKRYVKEILKKNPHHIDALILLANMVEKEGDKDALRKTYKQILTHDPKNKVILFNLGVLETDQGNLNKGVRYLKKLVSIDPNDIQARDALFDIYQRQNKNKLAFEQALFLSRFYPKKIIYHSFICNHLSNLNQFKPLAQYMRKAVKANPKNFELRQCLILAYLKLKKHESAVKEIENALKLKPNNISLLHHLAKINEGDGNLDQALQVYKKILAVSPDDEKAEKEYLRLRFELLGKKGNNVSDR